MNKEPENSEKEVLESIIINTLHDAILFNRMCYNLNKTLNRGKDGSLFKIETEFKSLETVYLLLDIPGDSPIRDLFFSKFLDKVETEIKEKEAAKELYRELNELLQKFSINFISQ